MVSVRKGERLQVEDAGFRIEKLKTGEGILQFEDPIEISRNLNFQLAANKINGPIRAAAARLKAGVRLQDFLLPTKVSSKKVAKSPELWMPSINPVKGVEHAPVDELQRLLKARLNWDAATIATIEGVKNYKGETVSCGCFHCFRWFARLEDLARHQSSSNHQGILHKISL